MFACAPGFDFLAMAFMAIVGLFVLVTPILTLAAFTATLFRPHHDVRAIKVAGWLGIWLSTVPMLVALFVTPARAWIGLPLMAIGIATVLLNRPRRG